MDIPQTKLKLRKGRIEESTIKKVSSYHVYSVNSKVKIHISTIGWFLDKEKKKSCMGKQLECLNSLFLCKWMGKYKAYSFAHSFSFIRLHNK